MKRPLTLGAICFSEFADGYAEFIEIAASRSLEWVEFKYEAPARDAPGSSDAGRVLTALKKRSIKPAVHLPFNRLNIADLDDAKREESVRMQIEGLRFAAAVGADRATIHSGSLPSARYTRESFAESQRLDLESLGRILRTAEELGIALCLENGNGYERDALKHSVAPTHMRRTRRMLGDRIGFTVDFGHGTYFSRDPAYLIDELGPDLVRLSHLHDNSGDADEHRPLGTGVLELEKLIRRYAAGKWTFPLNLEHKNVADLLASVDHFDQTLEKMKFPGASA